MRSGHVGHLVKRSDKAVAGAVHLRAFTEGQNIGIARLHLIVDDDAAHRLMLREAVKDKGHRPVEAASGEEGLKVLETEVINIIPIFEERIKAFDTSKIPDLIRAGEEAMEREAPYIRSLLEM